MPKPDLDRLWQIYTYIRDHWQANDGLTTHQLKLAVDAKIQIDSAYETYYAEAVSEYERLLAQHGDQNKALEILYSENQTGNPKLPDVAQYVIGEFAKFHVAFGGFKAFGFENFPGWMGAGPYTQSPPPYRTAEEDS